MRRSLAWGAFAAACVLAALVPLRGGAGASVAAGSPFPGWPSSFEGRPLRELPLTEREVRFAEGFPGRIGRFTDGEREVVLRWVEAPTRQLHPAEDCFRGLGYRVTPVTRVAATDAGWHHFGAERDGVRLAVREHITAAAGGGEMRWTDASAWYWSALLGRTQGPWWAVTVAEQPRGTGAAPP
jgi:hypothetical protein